MIRAAYGSTAKRIVILGPGEELAPDFQETYDTLIAPCLDKRDAGFALGSLSVEAAVGHRVNPTDNLSDNLMEMGMEAPRLGNGVFNRFTALRALKEAQDTLTTNPSLELPGIRIGWDLLLRKRHCDQFRRFLMVGKPITKPAKLPYLGREAWIKGFDAAREQGAMPPTHLSPRVILAYSAYEPKDEDAKYRQNAAKMSWGFHAHGGSLMECPFVSAGIPRLREILDQACQHALPEDIVVYANSDAGLTTGAVELIKAGVAKAGGVTCCPKRAVLCGGLFPTLKDNKMPGGVDVIAVSPAWWKANRLSMPDMFIGREAWDAVFMHLAEEWADGRALDGVCDTGLYRLSRAYTDDVCWHVEHPSYWESNRDDPANVHNRACAQEFFAAKGKKTIWA